MLNPELKLNQDIFNQNVVLKSQRDGFGEALADLGDKHKNLVVLCNDLSASTKTDKFAKKFPDRFVQVGIAEQNMAGIAAGLALSGKKVCIVSHATFNSSRNWDQIRMAICMNNVDVTVCGSHAGFSNGRDGATAEPLEDIALMRVLPNMKVVHPIDYIQTKKALADVLELGGPTYFRFLKESTPIITTEETEYKFNKAQILAAGKDITIVGVGPIIYEALHAAKELQAKHKIQCEVINVHTIKPIDISTIIDSAKKTKKVVTLEEHQRSAGFGSAVTEVISEHFPVLVVRIGVDNTFGESGSYKELKDKYGLCSSHIQKVILNLLKEDNVDLKFN